MCWVQKESSIWVVELLASKAAAHHCRGPFSKVLRTGGWCQVAKPALCLSGLLLAPFPP